MEQKRDHEAETGLRPGFHRDCREAYIIHHNSNITVADSSYKYGIGYLRQTSTRYW